MPLLSVAIVTHNEEQNIARTLASVAWAGEIIVVDSHSTDRTVEIARSFGAQVIQRDWPGFAAQKNFAIAQCTGEWVLSLDADEELSAELQHEMQDLLKSGHDVDAYYLKRRNLFLGRWMRHGGFYPDAKLRLFRRNAADPDRTPRFIDRAVHEVIAFDGPTAMLAGDLIHHAYPTLSDYIAHMDRYSTLGARSSHAYGSFHGSVLSGITFFASASSTAARAWYCTSTTRPMPVGSRPRRGRRQGKAGQQQGVAGSRSE
jgi:glycosyltransferase involved in cell wall biosynthesis